MPVDERHGRLPADTIAYLLDALSPADDALWHRPGGVPSGLARAAVLHGIEGWVLRRGLQLGVVLPELQRAVDGAVARHHRALLDLARASALLAQAGCPVLVVKGPALVALHGGPGLRSYVDLDLLVPPACLGDAVAALRAGGFRLLDANWPLLRREDVHELRLLAPSGGAVDLHWSLGRGPWTRDRSPSFRALASRSREVSLGPVRARVLGPADTVAHLAVHAAAAGGHRLLWCADLRATLAADVPHTEVVRAAAEWGAAPAVDLMLLRTRVALGPGAAPDLRAELGLPRLWRQATVVTERLSPSAVTGTSGSLARLVARSCRHTAGATCAAAVGKAGLWLLSRGRGTESTAPDLDPSSPASALHPRGGLAEEQSFFRAVAARARPTATSAEARRGVAASTNTDAKG